MTMQRKFILFGFGEGLVQLIPVILLPFYLEIFKVDGYGKMNLLAAFFALFIPLLSLCFNQVAIKALHAKQRLEVPIMASFTIILAMGALFAALVFCFSNQLGSFFEVDLILASISIGMLSAWYLIFKDIAIHSGKHLIYIAMVLCQVVATHSLVFILFYFVPLLPAWEYRFYGEIISYAIFGSFFCLFWLRKLNLSSQNISIVETKEFISRNLNIAIGTVPRMLLRWYRIVMDRQYLALFIGLSALGQYTVATQIATMLTFPLVVVAAYFSPSIVLAFRRSDITTPVIFVASALFLMGSTLLIWNLFSTTLLELYIGSEFNGLSSVISSLYISLFLTLLSGSMLSIFIQSGVRNKRYDFVLVIFAMVPLSLFLVQPSAIELIAKLNLSVSVLYFGYTCIEFIKITTQFIGKKV